MQHPRAAVDGLRCGEHGVHRGRREHVPDGHAGAEPDADVPEEDRQVPRSTAGDDPDVAGDGCVRPDEGPAIGTDGRS